MQSRGLDPTEPLVDRFKRGRLGADLAGPEGLRSISQGWEVTAVGDSAAFRGFVETWHHGQLHVIRSQGGAARVRRGMEHLGDLYDDYVQISVVHQGRATISQGDRDAICEAGDMLAVRLDGGFLMTTPGFADISVLFMPVATLEGRGINTRRISAVGLPAAPVVAALAGLLEHAFTMTPVDVHRLESVVARGIEEMVIAVLGLAASTVRGDDIDLGRAHARDRVIALIEENFTDPGFSADVLASRLGTSRRYVYSLFEDEDHPVGTRIRMRRLGHAAALFRSPAGRSLSVARVARASGYLASGAFSRAFVARYAMSPAAYRDQRVEASDTDESDGRAAVPMR